MSKVWKVITPKSQSETPLIVHFNEALDYSLLEEVFVVKNELGGKIEVIIEVLEDQTGIRINPNSVWSKGKYTLEIESRLEDVAGNNLNRLFDRDINKSSEIDLNKDSFVVGFSID